MFIWVLAHVLARSAWQWCKLLGVKKWFLRTTTILLFINKHRRSMLPILSTFVIFFDMKLRKIYRSRSFPRAYPMLFVPTTLITSTSETSACHEINVILQKVTMDASKVTMDASKVTIAETKNLKQFPCPTCYKSYTRLSYLTAHTPRCKCISIPLECSTCHKIFSTKSSLSFHRKSCCVPGTKNV